MVPPDDRLDRLLENARWMRALGIELAGATEGEDLVQEAWVAALEEPRAVHRPAAWMKGVLRHLAARARRGRERRTRRERVAARAEAQPAADELVAEAEGARALLRVVMELEEPFRATVLLRYWRGWAPERIAAAQGVPAATVRTRLHRAHARLRARLDQANGGRQAWAAVFLAPAGLPSPSAAVLTGGAWMGTKAVAAAGIALAVVAGMLAWRSGARSESVHSLPSRAVTAAPAEGRARPEPTVAPAEARTAVVAASAEVDEEGVLLYGAATDATGAPVALQELWLEDGAGNVRSASVPAAGSYSVAGLAPGSWTLRARARGHVSEQRSLRVAAGSPHQRSDLVLAHAPAIPVRIVDESGAPWKEERRAWATGPEIDVVVTPAEPEEGLCGLQRAPGPTLGCGEFLRSGRPGPGELRPGVTGLVQLAAAPPLFVSVILGDATLATRRVDGDEEELVFTLTTADLDARRGGVRVRFVDADDGRPLAGFVALDRPGTWSGGLPTGEGGGASFEERVPGLATLRFRAPDRATWSRCVRVPSGGVLELGTVPIGPPARVQGVVHGADGRPLAVRVSWSLDGELRGPGDLGAEVSTRSQPGIIDLAGLPRGRVRLRLGAPEHATATYVLDTRSGLVEGLRLELERGVPVVLRTGALPRGRQVTVADEGGVPLATWSATGRPSTLHLAPGRYQLWTGVAERVDSTRAFDVGTEPVLLDVER